MIRSLALGALLLVASCTTNPAFAQTVASDAAGTIWAELVTTVASAIVTTLVGYGLMLLHRYLGIQMDARARETIHSAAQTGLNLALAKYGPGLGLPGLSRDRQHALVAAAVAHVESVGAPDAITRLGLDAQAVTDIVTSKLGAMQAASATVAVTTGAAPAGG